jgi:hypothetical protein
MNTWDYDNISGFYNIENWKSVQEQAPEMTSLVVKWSEFLTTDHEVPGSIPGSTMGIFRWRGKIPMVTMVWVV